MNKKAVIKEPVTEDKLREVLKDYPTKKDVENIVYIKFDTFEVKIDDKLTQFRSDMFTRFDELMGELAQQREDRIFTDHDIKVLKEKSDEHEKRIKKLETNPTTTQ
ncbi:MAG TPA: hypothetical protein VLG67_02950 [Candidatus Saccharimonadales bacterium]|nr:hypothetical protein [Candidatus Saccharimonadales bacterium]